MKRPITMGRLVKWNRFWVVGFTPYQYRVYGKWYFFWYKFRGRWMKHNQRRKPIRSSQCR